MEFHVQDHLRPQTQVSDTVPPQLKRLLLPCSTPSYTSFPGGAILNQHVKEQGFSIWIHHFFVTAEAVHLTAYTPLPTNTMHYTVKGTAHCILAPDQAVCLTPDTYHLFYVPPLIHNAVVLEEDFISFHIDLAPSMLEIMTLSDPAVRLLLEQLTGVNTEGIQYHAGTTSYRVRTVIEEILAWREEDPGMYRLFLKSKVYELMRLYAREQKQTTHTYAAQSVRQRQLNEIVDYINSHIDAPLSLPILGAKFGQSPRNLNRLFQQYTGKSPGKFIFIQRMQHATALLLGSDIPIREIGFKVGLENFPSFERAFTRHYGFPPGKLRRLH